MSLGFPWDYLPTDKLKIIDDDENIINNDIPPPLSPSSMNNKNYKTDVLFDGKRTNIIKKELNEKDGIAILDLIYKKGGCLSNDNYNINNKEENYNKSLSYNDDFIPSSYSPNSIIMNNRNQYNRRQFLLNQQQQILKHKETFYTPSLNDNDDKKIDSLGIFDKFIDNFALSASSNIKNINIKILEKNKITIKDLIHECKVSITDLKAAGIINNLDDLIKLKFYIRDLTLNRNLFSVDKLTNLFNIYYKDLKEYQIGITPNNIIKCNFFPSELLTIQFDMTSLYEQGIRKNHMIEMRFKLSDWRLLGFNYEFAKKLNINWDSIINEFRWDKKEYMEMMNE